MISAEHQQKLKKAGKKEKRILARINVIEELFLEQINYVAQGELECFTLCMIASEGNIFHPFLPDSGGVVGPATQRVLDRANRGELSANVELVFIDDYCWRAIYRPQG